MSVARFNPFDHPFTQDDIDSYEADRKAKGLPSVSTKVTPKAAGRALTQDELLRIAEQNPPAPEWFEGEVESPFG